MPINTGCGNRNCILLSRNADRHKGNGFRNLAIENQLFPAPSREFLLCNSIIFAPFTLTKNESVKNLSLKRPR